MLSFDCKVLIDPRGRRYKWCYYLTVIGCYCHKCCGPPPIGARTYSLHVKDLGALCQFLASAALYYVLWRQSLFTLQIINPAKERLVSSSSRYFLIENVHLLEPLQPQTTRGMSETGECNQGNFNVFSYNYQYPSYIYLCLNLFATRILGDW